MSYDDSGIDPYYITCKRCESQDTTETDITEDVVGFDHIGDDVVVHIFWRRCNACGYEFGVAEDWWHGAYTWDYPNPDVYA